jgi:predicted metalloprotease with PDZ domain
MESTIIYRRWLPFMTLLLATTLVLCLTTQIGAKEKPDQESPAPPAMENEHGYLGVTLLDLNDEERQELKYKGDGVLVESVVEDSPAEEAGLKDDDVIYRFNGQDVNSEQALREAIGATKAGDKIEIQIMRDGDKKEIIAVMGSSMDALGSSLGHMNRPLRRMLMMETQEESAVWLGIEVQPLSNQLKDYFKVKGDGGVLVSSVEDRSPAKKAGLKAGDVIMRVSDKDIFARADIQKALRHYEMGDTVSIALIRGGLIKNVKAKVTPIPEIYRDNMPGMLEMEQGWNARTPKIKVEKKVRWAEPDSKLEESPAQENELEMQDLDQSIQSLQEEMDQLQSDMNRFHNELE